ncbi:nuclear transport factor 2 family protein [Candidatus Zixiibacteriota bacterium]
MKVVKGIMMVGLISILLYSVIIILDHPNKAYYNAKEAFIYSKGNAPEAIRSEIVQQLHKFQEGYTHRDTSLLKPFMEQLFSQDNILILGTQPREVLKDYDRAGILVSSDWRTWGDCTFLMDNAHISTSGNVAWISTIGYVEFDMSQFLVLPLKLTAVMVKENAVWKFQQMQFQFDLDFSPLLLTLILLLIWLPVSLVSLAVVIVRRLRKVGKGRIAATGF